MKQKLIIHQANLKMHQRAVHENDKPFSCEICKNRFRVKNYLKMQQKMFMKIKSHWNLNIPLEVLEENDFWKCIEVLLW